MHVVAVVDVAYGERLGYDRRLAQLLFIGWTSLACGLVMVAAVPAVLRGARSALWAAAGAASVFGVGTALLAPTSPGFRAGLLVFGGYVVVVLVVLLRAGRWLSSIGV